jgi:hypothetical protein
MVNVSVEKIPARDGKGVEPLPELKPWREVGWIFRDGEAVAIEREGDEIRERRVEI